MWLERDSHERKAVRRGRREALVLEETRSEDQLEIRRRQPGRLWMKAAASAALEVSIPGGAQVRA